jgi:putative nucleotidyltransferase with HDIG domain
MWAMVRDSKTNGEALIRLRCHEGATVVRDLGIGDGAAEAIYNLDEHWNGAGYPDHLVGEQIPLLARIVSVAQTLDVFLTTYGNAAAMACVKQRSGRWYDPAVVQAALGLGRSGLLWREIRSPHLQQMVVALEPQSRSLPTDEGSIDLICAAFAKVVDAKSHSTYRHSTEVARIACELGTRLGVGAEEMVTLRRAALLHDIGKLSVPNSILDKPGKLTAEEWMCVKRHPEVTEAILARIPTFAEITRIAASHHEKLDGSGYHRGVSGDQLCLLSRVLTTSDVFEALSGIRSYRESLPLEKVMAIMREDVPHKLDAECFCALGEITAARGPVAMGSLATA